MTSEERYSQLGITFYPRVAFIYHLAKDSVLKRANTVAGGLGSALLSSLDTPDISKSNLAQSVPSSHH